MCCHIAVTFTTFYNIKFLRKSVFSFLLWNSYENPRAHTGTLEEAT